MRRLIIFENESLFILFPKCLKTKEKEKEKYKYISWQNIGRYAKKLLKDKGFEEIPVPEYNTFFKEEFLREYNNAIGICSENYNHKIWWATDIASKDRFRSNMLNILNQFLVTINIIAEQNYNLLIVFSPYLSLIPSLKKASKDKGIQFSYFGNTLKESAGLIYVYIRKFVGVLYKSAKIYSQCLYAKWVLSKKIKQELVLNRPYYVIKTFLYNHSFSKDGSYRDVFFGCLPDFLRDKKNVLLYACILGNYRYCIKKIQKSKRPLIIPVEALLSIGNLIEATLKYLFSRIKITKKVIFFGHDITDIFNKELSRTFKGIQFYQFLHYWSTRNLLKIVKVETFLLTYENNPWEKMCTIAIKEASSDTKIIGYQHTVVPQSSVNMFISDFERNQAPLPNRIFTVGQIPKNIMKRYGKYQNGMIQTACGLRFEYLFQVPLSQRKQSKNILVALEGIFGAYKVVNYVLRELAGDKQYRVRLRTHPLLPLKDFQNKLDYNFQEVPNFELSHGSSLTQDIEWSDVVIYWGSTVALEALSMGKPVIHFDTGSVLSYDPLFECNNLKWSVRENEPLKPVIEKITSLDEDDFIRRRNAAKEYLKQYFYPVTEENLNKFIINE